MNTEKIVSFRLIKPLLGKQPDFLYQENQKYLLFQPLREKSILFLVGSQLPVLIVPDDNSSIIRQIKNRKNDDFFSTPLSNLKFKLDFINIAEGISENSWYRDGLLVKETNKIKKAEGEIDTPVTFKIISQQKMDIRKTNYVHLLKIEPLNLGIKGMPPITQLLFDFHDSCSGGISESTVLLKSKFYNNNILTETTGKIFTMKIKSQIFGSWNDKRFGYNTLSFGSNWDFDWDSWQEVDESEYSKPDKEGVFSEPTKNDNKSNDNHSFSKKIKGFQNTKIGMIIGVILVLIALILRKKKK
ncbi:hypothetical protein [endosymbiont GvMRE of Glomus versiforme]|uniref:hypothetical protein n=1 Tax=endosymbiont GvMRE of Glomus versiforme TaxID=2039283 RepID=UPI000ED92490|nr:hypothetical protein [endosymbiont GvMRE of Glomus versiforme]RHZ35210.1 hypothetical protein GvMRE_IIg558 [endosymbiont GvMRE of Glomus versiforme]